LNKQQVYCEVKMYNYIENGTITTVQGFKANGIHCGLKKKKKDLSLIYSDYDCVAAGTFTQNKVCAAPVIISRERIKINPNGIKAILINSGNANACTGQKGYEDALTMQKYCAEVLNLSPNQVLISSTGVIGKLLDRDKLLPGIKKITKGLSSEGGFLAAEGIMTTDKVMKSFAVEVKLSKGTVKIGAICKGSGMIMPNMATMLGFLTTDAKFDHVTLQDMLHECVDLSFNKISVDGETSTNDMVIMLANGLSNIEISKNNYNDYNLFKTALLDLCQTMAKSIVKDGEGATKFVTINIFGAKNLNDVDKVAKAIANSPLVKTALYGEDANWGRIISAIGNSGADVIPEKISIAFDDHVVLDLNYAIKLDEDIAKSILSKKEFSINVNLNIGEAKGTWWTCDFSTEYVHINGSYRT